MIGLPQLNALPADDFAQALGGIFERAPWVAARTADARPFASVLALHRALCDTLRRAPADEQLALIRAHPELAGRAAVRGEMTPASGAEQHAAGLGNCTADQYARLQTLNAAYGARFGFPFILAVRGHTVESILAALAARIAQAPVDEYATALREIGRIALFRLVDAVAEPTATAALSMLEDLAGYSDEPDRLTGAYLTPTQRATAARIRDFMLAAGLETQIDAVGNVFGRSSGPPGRSRRLLTGSHYDTVIGAGRYDGRLGIVLPIAVTGALRRAGAALPCPLEIIALAAAGSPSTFVRDPDEVAGFVQVNIAQGAVLLEVGGAPGMGNDAASQRLRVTGTPVPRLADAALAARAFEEFLSHFAEN